MFSAKCVSVRPGESCAKNLVVRDENGPAMQIVYYEVDFLLPELNPPRTIRYVVISQYSTDKQMKEILKRSGRLCVNMNKLMIVEKTLTLTRNACFLVSGIQTQFN